MLCFSVPATAYLECLRHKFACYCIGHIANCCSLNGPYCMLSPMILVILEADTHDRNHVISHIICQENSESKGTGVTALPYIPVYRERKADYANAVGIWSNRIRHPKLKVPHISCRAVCCGCKTLWNRCRPKATEPSIWIKLQETRKPISKLWCQLCRLAKLVVVSG
ncbi:uncharacterized protein LOC125033248 [Penaeus chinensis]|uniref:uncharacterized protein LOC125033248 n=1 Tax=Penaeus chinensis TaxID=139456 RepID=UPI001FB82E55|nr:uncharacterized protein LOC125033248 [Penaeus chinensis]